MYFSRSFTQQQKVLDQIFIFFLTVPFLAEYVSSKRNITVYQFDTVNLDCYSNYDESADWYFYDSNGNVDPIFVSGFLQPQEKVKYHISIGSGFYNLTIVNVSLQDSGEYECKEGWSVTGRPQHKFNVRVFDIDECSMRNDTCDSNADCTNTQGSFDCACKPGFTGDGFNCHDVDECNATCYAANENCVNTVGGYSCSCDQNYVNLTFFGDCTAIVAEMQASAGETKELTCESHKHAVIRWVYIAKQESAAGIDLREEKTILSPASGEYTIVLSDVDEKDSGYYVCINVDKNTKKGFHLNVSAVIRWNGNSSNKDSVIVSISVSATLVSLALMGAVILVFWIRAVKKRRHGSDDQLLLKPVELYSADLYVGVWGIAALKGDVYVAVHSSDEILKYSFSSETGRSFKNPEKVKIRGLKWPADMVADVKNNCLYISDRDYVNNEKAHQSHKRSLFVLVPGQSKDNYFKTKLDCNMTPGGLTVTKDGRLVVVLERMKEYRCICFFEVSLKERRLMESSRIDLSNVIGRYLLQCVLFKENAEQPENTRIVVSRKHKGEGVNQIVCFNGRGKEMCSYKSVSHTLDSPYSLVVMDDRFILANDCGNHRILILKWEQQNNVETLSLHRVLIEKSEQGDFFYPTRLAYDAVRALLYVGCGCGVHEPNARKELCRGNTDGSISIWRIAHRDS